MALLQQALVLLLSLVSLTFAADAAAWKNRNIYFALTDRVARSESDSGGSACGDLGNYCGGTFKGLQGKLDYIKGMGFDAIWITPVVKNSPRGYHGYWAQDLYAVNENYGTAQDLKDLVNAAHDKGMYIMADVVANHMGQGAISNNQPSPLNQESSYHPNCNIDYSNQNSIETCRIAGLPDLYTEKAEIRKVLYDWVKWLVNEYQFDGLRIDTVKHVEKDFWPGFSQAAGVYTIGEVWDGNPDYLAGYANGMDGLLNYAVYYPMNRFYKQQGGAQDIVNMHSQIDSKFPDATTLGTFIDNHDNNRWLSDKNDVSLFKNALAYTVLARGIPIVYYGSEAGYSGGADPSNREDLWRSNFNTDSELYKHLAALGRARSSAGGLPDNDHVHLYVTNNAYAWSRAGGDVIALTVNTGRGTTGQYCFDAKRSNGQWSNVFSGSSVSSNGNGQLCLNVQNGEPVVLTASSGATPTTTRQSTVQPTSTACPSSVAVDFSVKVETQWGDSIRVVGNNAQLGNWEPSDAPALSASGYTSSNPVWSGKVNLPANAAVQYKFVNLRADGSITWERDPNRSFSVPSCQASAKADQATWQ